MHYLGFVFVDDPTEAAVEKAMAPHQNAHWDWYRPGGRWDGFLQGDAEQEKRATTNGFNFAPENEQAARNCCKVSELPNDKLPHFFVTDWDFVPKEYYNAYEKSPHWDGYGAILPTPNWDDRYKKALQDNKDKFVVVVDAHN